MRHKLHHHEFRSCGGMAYLREQVLVGVTSCVPPQGAAAARRHDNAFDELGGVSVSLPSLHRRELTHLSVAGAWVVWATCRQSQDTSLLWVPDLVFSAPTD